MAKRLTILMAIIGICAVLVLIAMLPARPLPSISASAMGRFTNDDGHRGYMFLVTNHGAGTVLAKIARLNPPLPAPGSTSFYLYTIQTEMGPHSYWQPTLYEPPDRAAWTAVVRYYQKPRSLEQRLRAIGQRLGICGPGGQWMTAQTIKVER